MRSRDYLKQFSVDLSLARELDFNPYYPVLDSAVGRQVRIAGEDYIDLASNNYLGLATDPRVITAITAAARKYGSAMCGTPIATGSNRLFRDLEQRLATFCGQEDAVIFPSGYQANSALFAAITERNDLIIVDHFAHASLIQGIRTPGCTIKPFLHNDLDHLERLLRRGDKYRQLFVVTESVFSTEGMIAPFAEIVELCERYEALPLIDDSHGIGVIGASGRGILEAVGLNDFTGIYTASLGKALANAGGVVTGPRQFIEYLRYYCAGLIYSTALPPAVVAGVEAVLSIVESEFPLLSKRLWHNKKQLADFLLERGFQLAKGDAPITSVICGSTENTVTLARDLFRAGILTTPFVPPSTPPGQGRVRLIASADLTPADMDRVLHAFSSLTPPTVEAT